MTQKSELLSFAEDLARRAGAITLEYFGKPIQVERKGDDSPVTIADRRAEELIRDEIERRFPDHGILGEEGGASRPEADFQWIIDPIDGTKSFIRGVPLYGVLIALEERGASRLGVIHLPALDQLFSAETGGGARCNGEIINVAEAERHAETAVLVTSPSRMLKERPEFFHACAERFPLLRGWGDCYGYTLVASGRAQVMLDPAMNHWDMAALRPIIEEAGGILSDLDGVPTSNGAHCLGATPRAHAEILELLRAHPPADGDAQN